MKRTYQPKKKQHNRRHGFLKRNRTKSGKLLLKRRIQKGRWKLIVANSKIKGGIKK